MTHRRSRSAEVVSLLLALVLFVAPLASCSEQEDDTRERATTTEDRESGDKEPGDSEDQGGDAEPSLHDIRRAWGAREGFVREVSILEITGNLSLIAAVEVDQEIGPSRRCVVELQANGDATWVIKDLDCDDEVTATEREQDPETTVSPPTTAAPGRIEQLQPAAVQASAQIGEAFSGENVADGDFDTEWHANAAARPLELEFRWDSPVAIEYVELFNIRSEERFVRNHRIDGFTISVNDLAIRMEERLPDEAGGPHRVDIASLGTTMLVITITATHAGSAVADGPAFEEVALAEVVFCGSPSR